MTPFGIGLNIMDIVEFAEKIIGIKLFEHQKKLLKEFEKLPRDSKIVWTGLKQKELSQMKYYWFLESEPKYRYMLLSRMKQDCEYYFGNGNKNPNNLCASNERDQIDEMKALWNSFSDEDKPEWLTWEEILDYENRMCGD